MSASNLLMLRMLLVGLDVRDQDGAEVADLSERYLAAVQTDDCTLPAGVSYTFDGGSLPPRWGYLYTGLDRDDAQRLYDLACAGKLTREAFGE